MSLSLAFAKRGLMASVKKSACQWSSLALQAQCNTSSVRRFSRYDMKYNYARMPECLIAPFA